MRDASQSGSAPDTIIEMRYPHWYAAAITPCRSTAATSIRHASIAMSCVAPKSAASTAHAATIAIAFMFGSGWMAPSTPPATAAETDGMFTEIAQIETTTPACATSIQARRLPSSW